MEEGAFAMLEQVGFCGGLFTFGSHKVHAHLVGRSRHFRDSVVTRQQGRRRLGQTTGKC